MHSLHPLPDDSTRSAGQWPGRPWQVAAAIAFNLILIPVAQATAQCPPEYGQKPAWVGWLGIGLLVAGLIAGPLLAWWVFARSKGALLRWRLLSALGGLLLMLGVWLGCGAVAGHLIMRC